MLSNKLYGTPLGLWLLVPEYLRLGVWDLLKGCFSKNADDNLNARIGLQLVNGVGTLCKQHQAKEIVMQSGLFFG